MLPFSRRQAQSLLLNTANKNITPPGDQMKYEWITFEGLDGSGTSTQCAMLANHLRSLGKAVVEQSFPSNGPIGNLARNILLRRINTVNPGPMLERQITLLCLADMYDTQFNSVHGMNRIFAVGSSVVSTRGLASTFAYDTGFKHPSDIPVQGLLQPTHTIYLDVPVATVVPRFQSRAPDLYETAGKLQVAKTRFDQFFENFPGKYTRLCIDGLDADAVHSLVITAIKD